MSQLRCLCDRYNSRSQIKRNVYFNMFRVTGSEIKIHMGVSIFRENVPLLCCYLLIYELERLKTTFLFASVYGETNMVI